MSNQASANLFPLRRGLGVLPLTSRPLLPASKVIAPRTLIFIMVLAIGLPIVFFTRLVTTPTRSFFDYHPGSTNLAALPPPARPDAPATLSIPVIMKREEGDVGVAGWNGEAQAVKDALPMPTIIFATPPKCDGTAAYDTGSDGQAKRAECDQWWTVQESESAAASEIKGWVETEQRTEAGSEAYVSERRGGATEVDAGTATDTTTATQTWEQEAQETGSISMSESATASYADTAVATSVETSLSSSYSDQFPSTQSLTDASTVSVTPSTVSSSTDTAFQDPSLSSQVSSSSPSAYPSTRTHTFTFQNPSLSSQVSSSSPSASTRTHTFTGMATSSGVTTAVSGSGTMPSLSSSQASHVSSSTPPTTLHSSTTTSITKPHTSSHSSFIATVSSTDIPLAASTQSPSSDTETVNRGVVIAAIVLIIVGLGTAIIISILHIKPLVKRIREHMAWKARQKIRQDVEMGTRETATRSADPYTPVPPRVKPASGQRGEQGAERAGTPAECLPVQEAQEGQEQDPRVTAMKLLEGR